MDKKVAIKTGFNLIFNNKFSDNAESTFSSTGEDVIINFILSVLRVNKPSYIDIGAYDPYKLSNTALFYFKGRNGINIEPNPVGFKKLQKYRPRDINLNIGISNKKGILTYYVMDADTLNTFSEEEAKKNVEKWGKKIIRTMDIPVDSIDSVIEKYSNNIYPDFMNIDAEGVEMDILSKIDFARSKPKVICLETIEYAETGVQKSITETADFLIAKGYFAFANTHINTILVDENLWKNR